MTTITTGRISDKARWKKAGWLAIDVTVKSAKKNASQLASTWEMVMGYKNGSMSVAEYTRRYEQILARSQKNSPELWTNTLTRFDRIVFLCYCPPKEFCHRHLLATAFVAWGQDHGIEVEVVPEDGNIPPKPPGTKSSLPREKKTGDGGDHINIYSKGETELGRLLSNFANTPVKLQGETYASLEAYWYYLGIKWPSEITEETSRFGTTGWSKSIDPAAEDKKRIRNSYGFMAKKLGRELRKKYGEEKSNYFEDSIKAAMRKKVEQHPKIKTLLTNSSLPFQHYYSYGGKNVDAGFKWIVEEWEEIRRDLVTKQWYEKNEDKFSPVPIGPLPDEKHVAGFTSEEIPPRVLYHGHDGV
jgi:predicted NAD-dependent protein-ADP-ribosyltransferase YbiA (DUF1768 family)